jgi:hypothetical protein
MGDSGRFPRGGLCWRQLSGKVNGGKEKHGKMGKKSKREH